MLAALRPTAVAVALCLALSTALPSRAMAQDDEEPLEPASYTEEQRIAGWTMVSASALFLLGSVLAGNESKNIQGRIDLKKEEDPVDEQAIDRLRDKRETLNVVEIVCALTGVGLAISGATVLILDFGNRPDTVVQVTPWVGVDGAGVSLSTDF